MHEKELFIINMPIKLKIFLYKYNIEINTNPYISIVDSLITLAKASLYDINGNINAHDAIGDAISIFSFLNISERNMLIDELIEIGDELLTILIVYGVSDKVIHHLESRPEYMIFECYYLPS